MATPTFDPHWTVLGMPPGAYPPARFRLEAIAADALGDCMEVEDPREYDERGELVPRGLGCERIFGPREPGARRPTERDRRFGRVTLPRPVAHPLRGPLDALHELPVLPAGLRASEPGEAQHPVSARYASVILAKRAVLAADYPNAFREAYGELLGAVRDLYLHAEGSLVSLLGATPELRWERLGRLGERAAGPGFDPVWADDEDTHQTLACLAALGFAVVPR